MRTTNFYKVGNSDGYQREDKLVKVGEHNYCLLYGCYTDESGWSYHWRKNYDHKPSEEELRGDITDLVNKQTDAKILTGFVWNDKPVYLSTENQNNFKTAYDLARDTDGATLPVKFKLGEDADGAPVYHTFKKFDVLKDFILKATAFVNTTLNEGWNKKDIDYSIFDIEV